MTNDARANRARVDELQRARRRARALTLDDVAGPQARVEIQTDGAWVAARVLVCHASGTFTVKTAAGARLTLAGTTPARRVTA